MPSDWTTGDASNPVMVSAISSVTRPARQVQTEVSVERPFKLSRRRVLVSVAGMSATALLAACGGSPAAPGATAPAAPTAGGAAAGTAAPTPAPAQQAGQLKNVPRNRTLIHGITGTQLTDYASFNPFVPGIASSTGYPFSFEPAFYYNAYNTPQACGPAGMKCEDGFIPWQAESYEYNPGFTELTIKLRKGVEWSDGKPFTSRDIAFTVNMLKDNAPKLKWSVDMKTWVKEVATPDDQTVKFTLNNPNPRFMLQFFSYHFDIGIEVVPEHIWKGQDPQTFTFIDLEKGWPVTTGPWKMVLTSPQQRIYDRRDDWWAKKIGFRELPAPERIIVLPGTDETKMVQMVINNEADMTIDLRPNNMKAVLTQNPKITTWTGKNSPYGYRDWWPIGLGFNCMREPYNDPEIRWAINHAINRQQLVDIGYQGAGDTTLLPFPKFPALDRYTDTVKDLAAPINTFDAGKTAEIMQRKGYAKDGQGFWAKGGQRFSMVIYSQILFQDIVPILVEQLRRGGFDASFKQVVGTEFSQQVYTGNIDAFVLGHGGSVRDPYFTLRLYHSRYSLPTGERATYPYRWKNEQFDQLVDQIGSTGENEPKLQELFRTAMGIWIKDLPDIGLVQWFHRIPTNTTYWTGWPSEENPYINTAYWHRTSPLWINSIKPAQ